MIPPGIIRPALRLVLLRLRGLDWPRVLELWAGAHVLTYWLERIAWDVWRLERWRQHGPTLTVTVRPGAGRCSCGRAACAHLAALRKLLKARRIE